MMSFFAEKHKKREINRSTADIFFDVLFRFKTATFETWLQIL